MWTVFGYSPSWHSKTLETTMSNDGPDSGLHIDDDWKAEAAREKERLAQQEQAAAEQPGVPPGVDARFAELINLLAMQAAISLNGYQGPGGERLPPNHAAAKHQIDLLDVLDQKTQGNLTDEEKRVLDGVTHELRMQYVQAMGGGTIAPPSPG